MNPDWESHGGQSKAATIAAVVVVGLGVLMILPGIGILYFLLMIPVLITLARGPIPDSTDMRDQSSPSAMMRADAAASLVDRPISILLQIGTVFFILLAAFIAFCATCTASAIAGIVASDAFGFGSESLLGIFIVLVVLASLVSAILVFVFLFRMLVWNKRVPKRSFTMDDPPSRSRGDKWIE